MFFAVFFVWFRVLIFFNASLSHLYPQVINQTVSPVGNELYENPFLPLGYFHKVLLEHEYFDLATVTHSFSPGLPSVTHALALQCAPTKVLEQRL